MATDNKLATLAQLKAQLVISSADSDSDALLADALTLITDVVRKQGLKGRRVIHGAAFDEYHTIADGRSKLWLRDWPVKAASLTLYEDDSRVYATALVEGTDYLVDYDRGAITRVSGAVPMAWLTGVRVVKVRYIAGYDDVLNDKVLIPPVIRLVCMLVAARMWREIERKEQGVSSISSNAAMQFQRKALSGLNLSDDEMAMLEPESAQYRMLDTADA